VVMERMELMFETNQLDQDVFNQVPDLIRRIEGFLQIPLTGPCMTHLVKAVQRVKNNQAIQECSDELRTQMLADRNLYDFSLEILSPYNIYHTKLDAEAAFIASYFAMMMMEVEEG
jgi:hypothetical protein